MLLKLQIIIFLLAGVQSMEKEQWARHVVLIFYTDEITLQKGEVPPFEYFQKKKFQIVLVHSLMISTY